MKWPLVWLKTYLHHAKHMRHLTENLEMQIDYLSENLDKSRHDRRGESAKRAREYANIWQKKVLVEKGLHEHVEKLLKI